jgi:hypothetical protein
MAFCAPMAPINGECVPVGLPPVVPEPLIPELVPGLSDGPVAPDLIPLELLPDCCASTSGAATKTTARANMMVLLSLLVIDMFLFLHYTSLSSPDLYTPAALPYVVPAVGSVPLGRPCHRESNSYAMRNSMVPERCPCLRRIQLSYPNPALLAWILPYPSLRGHSLAMRRGSHLECRPLRAPVADRKPYVCDVMSVRDRQTHECQKRKASDRNLGLSL